MKITNTCAKDGVMPILAVDVDEVLVDVLPLHLKWCNIFAGTDYTLEDIAYEYDLSRVFPEMDGVMDFWSTPHLYQKLKPKEGTVEALTALNKEGWEIGFVTYCKKAHLSSKCKWLKQHFPFYKFIQATKEKGYTRCDYFIDDRHKYLNSQSSGVKLIKFDTPYVQEEPLEPKDKWIVKVSNWQEIYKLLKGEEDEKRNHN